LVFCFLVNYSLIFIGQKYKKALFLTKKQAKSFAILNYFSNFATKTE